MDEVTLAMLGDREAQERVTERGELLPCPFCGASGDDLTYYMSIRNTGFVCEKCRATQDGYLDTYDEALKSWNTRHALLAPEQIKRLEETEA